MVIDRVMAQKTQELGTVATRTIALGDLTINLAAIHARWQDRPISLMPKEYRLLRDFVDHPGRVFTRSQLTVALGKQEPPIDERTVDVWIGRLRRARRTAGAGEPLRTVQSLGYVLDQP